MTLRLRELRESDLPILREWRNRPETMAHTRETRFLTDEDQRRWWQAIHDDGGRTMRVCGVFDDNFALERLVGLCALMYLDWQNSNAEVSFLGDKPEDESEIVALLVGEARRIGLHRLYAEALTAEREVPLKAAGFSYEGQSQGAYRRRGQWWNAQRWGLIL